MRHPTRGDWAWMIALFVIIILTLIPKLVGYKPPP